MMGVLFLKCKGFKSKYSENNDSSKSKRNFLDFLEDVFLDEVSSFILFLGILNFILLVISLMFLF